jgi:hypothetical protein
MSDVFTINQSAVDRYTSIHAGFGATMAYLGVPWWAAMMASIAWELVEDSLKQAVPGVFPYASHDSAANAIGDTVAVMAGWQLAHAAQKDPSYREEAALSAAVGATVGALVMPLAAGLATGATEADRQRVARAAYTVGNALGAAAGTALALYREHVDDAATAALHVAVSGLAGGLGGPVAAAAAGYIGGSDVASSRTKS